MSILQGFKNADFANKSQFLYTVKNKKWTVLQFGCINNDVSLHYNIFMIYVSEFAQVITKGAVFMHFESIWLWECLEVADFAVFCLLHT